MTWLPKTEQASLNEDAIMSTRRARSTDNWCKEDLLLKDSRSFEIQNQWTHPGFTAQVS